MKTLQRRSAVGLSDAAAEPLYQLLAKFLVEALHELSAHQIELGSPYGVGTRDREHAVALARRTTGLGDRIPDRLSPGLLRPRERRGGSNCVGQAAARTVSDLGAQRLITAHLCLLGGEVVLVFFPREGDLARPKVGRGLRLSAHS